MTNSTTSLQLLQARARLRQDLPILPEDEDGIMSFSYPELEGFLFALFAAPYEIDWDRWTSLLDRLIPDACYNREGYQDDILMVYDDMERALLDGLYFQVHTLSISSAIPVEAFPSHPLRRWQEGFLIGFNLAKEEMEALPKRIRKRKEYRELWKNYFDTVLQLMALLKLKVLVDGGKMKVKEDDFSEDLSSKQTMEEIFSLVLKEIHETGLLAAVRLERIL